MKKIIHISLGLALGLASLIDAMQQPQNPAVIAIHARNKARSQANEAQYQGQPFYTLFVMQPTPGYRTLNSCVDFLFANNKFPAGYNKIPQQNWHISTIAIAVPFDNQPNAQEVDQAAEELRQIVARFKRSLAQVAYKFSKLSSIGTHKFIAAHYDFTAGRREFLNAYAKIYRDFLAKYPKAYMYYGYTAVPHISVASTANPGNAVHLNTRQCRRINNVALLHNGRNLYVATGFYNPQSKRIDRNQTQAI